MVLPTHSQTTSKLRAQAVINSAGDTLIQLKLADAKIILNDVLDKQVSDSMLTVYLKRDSLNSSTILFQKKEIVDLVSKTTNLELIIDNDKQLVSNKDKELTILNEIIKKQKKEIIKQKVLKIIGFTAAVVLPITLILLTL